MTADLPRHLDVETFHTPEGVRLVLVGELDIASRPILVTSAEVLLVPPNRKIVVDMAGVAFCDSSGVHALVDVYTAAISAGWNFQLVKPRTHIRRILEIAGVTRPFNITEPDPEPDPVA